MLTSICRQRRRLLLIPAAAVTNPTRPNPGAVLTHGYSSTSLAGAPDSEPCPATVSCGVSPAAAAARKLRIPSTDKADAVLALLRRYGFSEEDITEIARRAPFVLNFDPDRILGPKLELFTSLGVQPRKLARTPYLLGRSLENHLAPCIQFLRGILRTDRNICIAITRTPRAMGADLERNMRPTVEALRRHGLPEDSLSKLLMMEMGVLMITPDRIRDIFEDLKALRLNVTDTGFIYGIRALCCLSRETYQRKLALYRSFGVSEVELRSAFKTQPTMLLHSDEGITKKLRFILDELKLELSDVMGHPVLIGYSLEKTIIPRCAVLSVLMREGKIKPDIKILQALLGSAKYFSEKFVLRYAHDVPDVVEAYEGKIKFEGFKDPDVSVPLKL